MAEPERGAGRGGGDEPPGDALRHVVAGSTGCSVEAQVAMLGRFSSGARRARGLRGLLARGMVLLVLAPVLLAVVWGVATLPAAFR